jgi:hypothetical protein
VLITGATLTEYIHLRLLARAADDLRGMAVSALPRLSNESKEMQP